MHGVTPAQTPWRVIEVAVEPRKLLESNILENLNPASKIADTSWIIRQPRNLASISDATSLEEQLPKLTGVDGVRIDLKNRTDQQMVEFRRHAAEIAAQHHLMIEFQNAPPPDGMERTWPNVLPREDRAFRSLLGRL